MALRATPPLLLPLLLLHHHPCFALKLKLDLPPPPPPTTHFDLAVIGGGSGGLAASKAAAQLGKRVVVFDFVKPSPAGTTWGLGGTCVNVGCIPKKLMHHAAQLGGARRDSAYYGWEIPEEEHEWETLTANVQKHVKSLNFANRVDLRSNDVTYHDAFAVFKDAHTLEATTKDGATAEYTADAFIVCPGGRPRYPDEVAGAREHCITSDDIFSLRTPPGRTLVVGASYVGLECAGFLHGLGYETTVMVRSVPLRGFDSQMAEHVVEHMRQEGVSFIEGALPTSVEVSEAGRKLVHWRGGGEDASDEFDTVLLAVGRDAFTQRLRLDRAGVQVNPANGKIPTLAERTNVPHIYAIGDVIDGDALEPPSALTELTPVAIQAGRLLARRLYAEGPGVQMDYQLVPTTIYTPLEYGCVGYTEEAAIQAFGEAAVEVHHQYFTPLEWRVVPSRKSLCYSKLVVHTADAGRVVGLHVCGPHAGEMTQGFAVAIKCGATKEDFDSTVGIHPTTAEIFTTLDITKRSGASAQPRGC